MAVSRREVYKSQFRAEEGLFRSAEQLQQELYYHIVSVVR